jgi:hypothetical protein
MCVKDDFLKCLVLFGIQRYSVDRIYRSIKKPENITFENLESDHFEFFYFSKNEKVINRSSKQLVIN